MKKYILLYRNFKERNKNKGRIRAGELMKRGSKRDEKRIERKDGKGFGRRTGFFGARRQSPWVD